MGGKKTLKFCTLHFMITLNDSPFLDAFLWYELELLFASSLNELIWKFIPHISNFILSEKRFLCDYGSKLNLININTLSKINFRFHTWFFILVAVLKFVIFVLLKYLYNSFNLFHFFKRIICLASIFSAL